MIHEVSRMAQWRRMGLGVCCAVCGVVRVAAADYTDADAVYEKARTCYHEVKKTPEKQRQRDAWEACIRGFLQVERDYAASERAVEASFTVGKLYEEMYDISKNVEDLRLAMAQFNQFAKQHKKHRLADDALYRVGKIRWEGFHQKGQAKSVMWKVIRWYPEGDMAIEAKKFLRGLDEVKGSARPAGALLEIKPKAVKLQSPVASRQLPAVTIHQPPSTSDRLFTIVIDPGHGGKDAGAVGPKGTHEKQVTLAIGKKLAAILRQQYGYQASLTRETDLYLTLDERNAIANRRKADLFISIHANASESREQHGIQTYYLNNASDDAARRLADRENKVAGKSAGELERIVATMLQNAVTEESRELAREVHASMLGRVGKAYAEVQDQGVRTALFYVLVGAKSPSILVETSYLSHPTEEQRLRDPRYQTTVAQAIARGIAAHVRRQSAAANL